MNPFFTLKGEMNLFIQFVDYKTWKNIVFVTERVDNFVVICKMFLGIN